MNNYFRDPTLVELLSDPLTHAVMRADHVRTYCAIWRADGLIPWLLRPASGSASADHLKRRGKENS
jgi:hypothetical protein